MRPKTSSTAAGLFAATVLLASPAAAQFPGSTIAMPPNAADVEFMTGMIPHHAQAVLIAGWAVERTSQPSVKVLSQRIIVAQKDEIAMMQLWLQDRKQPVPAADATHHVMVHEGTEHRMLMPGMLSDEELRRLQAASGPEFDRLYLAFMIRHHEGALTMVETLFKAYGAAQDETVFRFASDVFADQTTEIDRMQQMLAALGGPVS